MFPMVSQKFSNNEKYDKIFFFSLIFTLSVCSLMLSLFYFFPEYIIKFSVGSSYLKASNMLFLFGIFMSLVSLANLLINFQLALRRTKVVFLPALAAISQIVFINYFHSSLYQVILVSIISTLCLLTGLIIFSLKR
jgi:O-antigen/teichoic acid export membrane protein